MEEEKKKAYSEVVEILKLIEDEKKLEKIPFEVIELIKRNADPSYKPTISKDMPLEDQNLRNETFSILGWIANKYWNENIELEDNEKVEGSEKIESTTTLEAKDEKHNTQCVEQNNFENIHIATETDQNSENIDEKATAYNDIDPQCLESSNLPTLVPETKWYEKIKMQVIRLFKLIFGIKNKDEESNKV